MQRHGMADFTSTTASVILKMLASIQIAVHVSGISKTCYPAQCTSHEHISEAPLMHCNKTVGLHASYC